MKAGCEVVVAGYDAPPNGRYWGNSGQRWILPRASEARQIEDAIACSKRLVLQGPRPVFTSILYVVFVPVCSNAAMIFSRLVSAG
jgi:hypothetical protein